jgi:aquaporin Z
MANPNKYLAEFLGTLLLVVTVLASGGQFLAVGAALSAAIYFTNGGHINPAVSLAMFVNKRLSLSDLAGYVVAQLLGGVTSVYLYNAVLKM